MNYELCKKLKDAGFPQAGNGELFETEEGRLSRESMGPVDSLGTFLTQIVYSPTLEELIEACAGRFGALMIGPGLGLWTARGSGIETHCSTYYEAVANLWLELNKK